MQIRATRRPHSATIRRDFVSTKGQRNKKPHTDPNVRIRFTSAWIRVQEMKRTQPPPLRFISELPEDLYAPHSSHLLKSNTFLTDMTRAVHTNLYIFGNNVDRPLKMDGG